MKTVLRTVVNTAFALTIVAVPFYQHYAETKLVSNISGVALVIDPQLVDPWGLARTSGSAWWVATGVSTLYNGPGVKQALVVTIPPADPIIRKRLRVPSLRAGGTTESSRFIPAYDEATGKFDGLLQDERSTAFHQQRLEAEARKMSFPAALIPLQLR
jgi:hypothetical protein